MGSARKLPDGRPARKSLARVVGEDEMDIPQVVSPEEWRAARIELLADGWAYAVVAAASVSTNAVTRIATRA
jgi:hypothetical protein